MRIIIFAVVFAIVFAIASANAWSLDEGQAMPDFSVISTNGNDTQMHDLLEGSTLTYVEFWATWCTTCKKSFPFLNDMQSKYREKGFNVVAVSMDVADEFIDKKTKVVTKDIAGVGEAVRQFLEETPASFDVVYGDASVTAETTGVLGVPVAALVDANGKVISMHKGFNKTKAKQLEKEIINYFAKN